MSQHQASSRWWIRSIHKRWHMKTQNKTQVREILRSCIWMCPIHRNTAVIYRSIKFYWCHWCLLWPWDETRCMCYVCVNVVYNIWNTPFCYPGCTVCWIESFLCVFVIPPYYFFKDRNIVFPKLGPDTLLYAVVLGQCCPYTVLFPASFLFKRWGTWFPHSGRALVQLNLICEFSKSIF